MKKLSIIFPDDWHCHLRDGEYLTRTVPDIAHCFKRAIVMPNLAKPITTIEQAEHYRNEILKQVPAHKEFNPLMTLYFTESLSREIIEKAKKCGFIYAIKLYPAGVTTHSEGGIKNLEKIYPLLEIMEAADLPLLVHGETPDLSIDIFEREKIFLEKTLSPMIKQFPQLRIVLEHISTKTAVDFIKESSKNMAATITPHHLLLNRNDLLSSGIKPHYYCLPILKTEDDRQALIKAATSGNQKFFLGTDSAPHSKHKKESCCGSAGIYSSHAAIELYAEIFGQHHALDQLEKFASINGPNFYQLPVNTERLTLVEADWQIPAQLSFGNDELIPLKAGQTIRWKVEN